MSIKGKMIQDVILECGTVRSIDEGQSSPGGLNCLDEIRIDSYGLLMGFNRL